MHMVEIKPTSVGQQIKTLAVGQFLTVESFKGGSGSLQARKLSSGDVKLYWRFTHENVKLRDEIGRYDSSAPPLTTSPTEKGYSLRAAAEVCRIRAKIHLEGKLSGGWPSHKSRIKTEHDAAKAEFERISEQTLSKLMDTYCDYLKSMGRPSHADARSIFQLHIKDQWPDLVSDPAATVKPEEIADVLRKVQEAGKLRTASKLRSYLRAAYQCAAVARLSPDVPAAFKVFQITVNPVQAIPAPKGGNEADKNPLSEDQMRVYWRALAGVEGVKGAALRLHLLSGGQRIEQFIKLLKVNVLGDRFVLVDPKGKRGQEGALRHRVALTDAIKKELQILQSISAKAVSTREAEQYAEAVPMVVLSENMRSQKMSGQKSEGAPDLYPYLISTDGGATHVNAMTLTRWAQAIAQDIPDFQLKRVRSGVETALAKAGVSLDLRGLLQSHGLSGLQRKHYDGHDYIDELKEVLLRLDSILNVKVKSKGAAQIAHKRATSVKNSRAR